MSQTSDKKPKVRKAHKNSTLAPGVCRFGRSKMYHKKGIWAKRNIKNPKQVRVYFVIVIFFEVSYYSMGLFTF